jgi:hypothetical protein
VLSPLESAARSLSGAEGEDALRLIDEWRVDVGYDAGFKAYDNGSVTDVVS